MSINPRSVDYGMKARASVLVIAALRVHFVR